MLTGPKTIQRRPGRRFGHPMKAGATIHRGAIVVLEAGLAIAATTAANLVTVGFADVGAVNEGGDGDAIVEAARECIRVEIDPADPVTTANVGAPVFLVDDETVAATDAGGTRSPAGTLLAVEDGGAWVALGD